MDELGVARSQVRKQLIDEIGYAKAMEVPEWDLLKTHAEFREINNIMIQKIEVNQKQ